MSHTQQVCLNSRQCAPCWATSRWMGCTQMADSYREIHTENTNTPCVQKCRISVTAGGDTPRKVSGRATNRTCGRCHVTVTISMLASSCQIRKTVRQTARREISDDTSRSLRHSEVTWRASKRRLRKWSERSGVGGRGETVKQIVISTAAERRATEWRRISSKGRHNDHAATWDQEGDC